MKKNVFLICPVRNVPEETEQKIREYIKNLEDKGYNVYYPARDTDQNDSIGYRICSDNRIGLLDADEIHIWYDKNSQGSTFDLGMAFGAGKKLFVANREEVEKERTPHKSFPNMILEWDRISRL